MRHSRRMGRAFGAAGLVLFATSCLPAFTTLQRATTLPPGTTQVAVVASALGIAGTPFATSTTPPDPLAPVEPTPVEVVPNGEFVVRRGLLPNVDAGLRVWFTGLGLAVDAKWRFLQTERLQLAIAPALGIDLLSLMAVSQQKQSAGAMVAAYLPLIAGLRTGVHELLFGVRLVGAMYAFQSGGTTSTAPLLVPGGFVGYDVEVFPWLHVVPEVDAYCTWVGTGCLLAGAVAVWFP